MAKRVGAHSPYYQKAIDVLTKGGLVALPTETVYGLAGLADNAQAVEKIRLVKNRPHNKPLPIMVFSHKQAQDLVVITPLAQELMHRFWPGPLTLVMPAKSGTSLALRCPDSAWRNGFLSLGFNQALVLPSANISGQPAPIRAHDICPAIKDQVGFIVDDACNKDTAGKAELGKSGHASTILRVENTKLTLLRAGALAPEHLAKYAIDGV